MDGMYSRKLTDADHQCASQMKFDFQIWNFPCIRLGFEDKLTSRFLLLHIFVFPSTLSMKIQQKINAEKEENKNPLD